MPLFTRNALGQLIAVNPGLPARRGNQGGMGAILSEAELMARLPDADLAGAIGPGVVPGGEQSLGARRATLEAEAAPPPADTYRPLGGAQQNNRGQIQTVILDSDAGTPEQKVASIVQTPLRNGDDAEVLTVTLGFTLPNEFSDPTTGQAGNIPVGVTAIIEWGIGGAQFSAECDWAQGTTFAITASFLRVSARVDAIPAVGMGVWPLVLTASLGYGNASTLNTSSPLRRTIRLGSLAAGDTSAVFVVPTWAVGFTLIDSGELGNGDVPNFLINVGPTSGQGTNCFTVTDRSNLSDHVEGQFPVPIDGRFIVVKNRGMSPSSDVKLIFNLAF